MKGIKRKLIISIILISFIPGCLMDEQKKDQEDENPFDDIIPPNDLPPMIVAHTENLTRYEYNNDAHQFFMMNSLEVDNPRSLINMGDYYFFVYNNGIKKLYDNLTVIKEIQMEKMGVMVESEGILYFSAGESFYSCDPDLEILCSLKLNISGLYYTKIVHDIIINDNIAYLVDNVVTPYYIFKVDISDPEDIFVIQRINVWGVNSHLYDQWLDIEKDRWMVIQNGAIMTGSYEYVLLYSLENGSEITTQEIYWYGWHEETSEGFHIRSILPINPTWCMISSGSSIDTSYHLANISIVNDEVKVEEFLNLYIDFDLGMYNSTIKDSNIELNSDIVYATVRNNLRIIDMKGIPKLTFTQTLDQNIIDVIIIME